MDAVLWLSDDLGCEVLRSSYLSAEMSFTVALLFALQWPFWVIFRERKDDSLFRGGFCLP